jgi:FKBP-type peptidyl-prolyl cis-trans isomerase FkpA
MNSIPARLRLFSRKLQPIALALVGMLFAVGMTLAEEAVPFPTLPQGAGPIDPNASKTFITTESGLKYRILRAGSKVKPTPQQQVEVNYHGWLIGDKLFDSSYLAGKSATFGLTQVVKGWTEGMQLIGKGGMIELEIPGYLGYGLAGKGGNIPPNATLHFLVELIDIKPE